MLEVLNRIADNVTEPNLAEKVLAAIAVFSAFIAFLAAKFSLKYANETGGLLDKIKVIFDKQAKLEEEKGVRHQWEHTVHYAPWLLIELGNGSLEEQINNGPMIFFEKNFTARMIGYRVNDIDLSEGTEQFQISEKNKDKGKGKQYPNLLERLNNNQEKYDGLMANVLKSIENREIPHASIDIIYRDMGSDYFYKRTFYFDYDSDNKRLKSKPKLTYDSPRLIKD